MRCVRPFWQEILLLSLKFRTRGTEPTLVMALIDGLVALWSFVFCDLSPQMLNSFVMKRFGRPHKNVIPAILGIQPKVMKHPLHLARNVIRLFFRRSAILFSRTLYVY